MSDFLRMADLTGNELASAGIGLETIANLLGADGIERHLSEDDISGLRHTLLALSAHIKSAGYDPCEAVEDARESQEVPNA